MKYSCGSFKGIYAGPGTTGYDANPLLRVPNGSKELLSLEEQIWICTINSLAGGKRRDLLRAIKEKTKMNQAQSQVIG